MTPRQIEKAVQKAAFTFEQEIEKGFAVDNRQTFSEYARYVIRLKEHSGKKTPHHRKLYRPAQTDRSGNRPHPPHRTAAAAPQFLYENLKEEGIRSTVAKAKAKQDIQRHPEAKTPHKGRCSGCRQGFHRPLCSVRPRGTACSCPRHKQSVTQSAAPWKKFSL